MSVLVVPEQAYLADLGVVRETRDCLTHVAILHHPSEGRGRYYLKYYLDGPRPSRGLANEVCGYLLGVAAEIPVPEHALILTLPRERIVDMHPSYASQIREPLVPVWATSDAGQPLPSSLDVANESLRSWPDIGRLIAFDTWLVISDRSAANLVRRGRRLFVIDHGHLGGSVFWDREMLPVGDESRHPFLSLWTPGRVPDEVNQRIIFASEGHASCLSEAEAELSRLMEPLLGDGGDGDRMALLRFLQERARSGPARMKRVLNMLA